jgi:hypothetical protein
MATRWDEETTSSWEEKGKSTCGNVLKEADTDLKKSEA